MLKKVLNITIAVFLTLFFLEVSTRILAPQNISPVIGELDPILGYKLKATVTAVHKTGEFDTIVRTNAEGYRSASIPYSKGNKSRILFLGDSFTYGWGVNEEERFSDSIAQNLDVEMLNAGVPGYKLSNILAHYEAEGYKYNPNIVVLAYNLRTGTPNINSGEYDVVNGTLVKKPLYVPTLKNQIKNIVSHFPLYPFLSQHSHLFAFARNSIVALLNSQAKPITNCTLIEENWYNSTKEREVLVVQELAAVTKEKNQTFVFVMLPVTFCDFDTLLIDFIDSTNVSSAINLDSFFANNTQRYYYPLDGHWNKEGHAHAAELLLPALNSTIQEFI